MSDNVKELHVLKEETIYITEVMRNNHLKLLATAVVGNLFVDNCEFGAIGIDPKRPFGNSHVEPDILEIIGLGDYVNPESDDNSLEAYARELYHEHVIPYIQRRWKEQLDAEGCVMTHQGFVVEQGVDFR